VATVRTGPLSGLIAQVGLLAALAETVGLGVTGWFAGITYGIVTCLALTRGLHRSGAGGLGPADRVTLTRATLVGGVTALAADALAGGGPAPVDRALTNGALIRVLVGLAVVALALDAVDGQVARRTGTVSALGARFDMEVDAFLILVLSVYVARTMGGWVLAIGAMRYAYVVASWLAAWMRGPLPARQWRKVVAATQGIILVVATAGVLPRPLTVATVAAALALLVESFGRDVGWLWLHRPVRLAPVQVSHRSQVGASPTVASETVAWQTVATQTVTRQTKIREYAAVIHVAGGPRAVRRDRRKPLVRRRAEPAGATMRSPRR
jgi:phosphatidylglycerophosphate synthase